MRIFRVEFTDFASEELRDLQLYIAKKLNNPEAAFRRSANLVSSARSLAVSPKRHRVRKTDSHGRELRFFPVDNYTLVYSVDDDTKIVSILRIIYGRRNIDSML